MLPGDAMEYLSALRNQRAYDIWSSTYDQDRPPHTYLEQSTVLRLLDPQVEDKILDAACGSGRYTKLLQERGATVAACDFSSQMLTQARAKCPGVEMLQVDLNQPLPYKNQSFTKCVCSLSIRHIEDMPAFVKEVFRVLSPGGRFVFSSIHPQMDWTTYVRANPPPIELNDEGQTFPYSESDFFAALVDAGFTGVESTELLADDSIKTFLTPASFQAQQGRKFVLVFSALRA